MLLFVSFVGAALVMILVSANLPIPGFAKFIILIVGLVLDILAAATRFYSNLFIPFYKMKNGTVVLSEEDPFLLSPSGEAIISRRGESVYATAFLKIPVYRSATEMSAEEKVDFARLFSRIITLSKTPFKLSTQLYTINKDDYIGRISDKLSEVEELYQKDSAGKSAPQATIDRERGQITMWHNLLESISKAQSHALLNYASVTAVGGSEDEAISLASQQADELSAGIGSILGATPTLISGQEILLIVQPEYTIPFSTVSEQIRQKTMEEGL